MRMSPSFVRAGGFCSPLHLVLLVFRMELKLAQLCDLSALKEFTFNLSAGSIIATWSDQTCREWDGVFCGSSKDGTGMSRGIKFVLPRRGLAGVISGSLGCMDQPMLLDLSYNSPGSELLVELSSLKQLQILDLSYNLPLRTVEVIKGKNSRKLVSWVLQMKSEKRKQEIIDRCWTKIMRGNNWSSSEYHVHVLTRIRGDDPLSTGWFLGSMV